MPKKKSLKISVCIPVRNAELWLAETIDSILNQTIEEWEIVIVDDASTDATREIIANYVEKYPEKINGHLFEEQQGIAICRNKAVEIAKADIICVQDADDISHKDRLKKTYEYLKRHKKCDLVYGACQYIDPISKPFHMVQAEPFDFERLKLENWIQHPTVAYRKSSFLKVGGYRPECRVIDDWFLYFDFYKKGMKIEPMEDVLAFYRFLPTSVSRNEEKQKEVAEMKKKFREEAARG